MAINDGISGNDTRDPFPGIAPWGNRPAGSAGDQPGETAGPVLASPVVSVPGASSQLPASMPTLAVTSGDTSGMSSDQAAQASPISPGPAGAYLDTGAGHGNANPYDHPAGG